MVDAGVYVLELLIQRPVTLQVGALGWLEFSPGLYFYCGRASRNLPWRIYRHLKKEKLVRWHIDYLTAHPSISVTRLFVFPGIYDECGVNQEIRRRFRLLMRHPGFGSSDCRRGCESHLSYRPFEVPEYSDNLK